MTYEYIKNLKITNHTLKLLNSENIAMMVPFFYFVFIEKKNITLNHTTILNYLDDYLYNLNQTYDNNFVKEAKDYLDDFVNNKNGYLRKYHGNEDEALYELTPHTQKALEFLEGLEKSEFVGSRSKFNVIFELLEELEFETNLSDEQRVASLQEQKNQIDKKIEAIKNKKDLRFDNSRVKEHFMLIVEQTRKLKYDFSQIEYNFRALNTTAMEKIVSNYDSKGDILDIIFDEEDRIRQSDQGKSFFSFWQLLTDAKRNEKLTSLLENLYKIAIVKEFDKDEKLKDLKYDLLQSGEKISSVFAKLIEQLRRFLDDRLLAQNRRVLELCKKIEKNSIDIKTYIPTSKNIMSIKGQKVNVDNVFVKSLYTIKEEVKFTNEIQIKNIKIDMDSFYNQFFIDEEILKRNINQILLSQNQCTIEDIVKKYKIKKGVSELVGYVSIAKNSTNTIVYEDKTQSITILDIDGAQKNIIMPKIIFTRDSK